jgi:hypothetical protein
MSDQSNANEDRRKGGVSKIAAAIISAIFCRHLFSYIDSRYGTNFILDETGMSPGLVKDTITGTLIAGSVTLTPQSVLREIKGVIFFVRCAFAQIHDACNKPIDPSSTEKDNTP